MRPRSSILVLLLVVPILALLWRSDRLQPFDRYDQRFYLGIAYDLQHHHRFTDGFLFAGGGDKTIRPPGMRFTPLYPAILAAASWLDPRLARDTTCLVAQRGNAHGCGVHDGHVRLLQFLMLVAVFWMIWWQGCACGLRERTGWIALALALPTAPLLLLSVDYLMTEIVSLFLSTLAITCMLQAVRSRSHAVIWAIAAGVTLGLATLSRPAFELLTVACIAVAASFAVARPAARTPALGLALGALVPIGGWVARNWAVLHRAALSFGYASHTFVQRLSFDSMSWHDYALSFACWMPDGNGIGGLLAGRHACDRFGWDDHPDSFYAIGIGPMLEETLRKAGGWDHHMAYLLHTYLLAEPARQIGWHLLVTIPLFLRGMFVDHWWGLVLSIPCLALTVRALGSRAASISGRASVSPKADMFLVIALPGWLMLALNAAIAVNQPRYNLMMIAPFAIAGALALDAPRRSRFAGRLQKP